MEKRVLVYGMTDNPGGIETYLMNTMKELHSKGVQFDFLCDFPTIAYEHLILANGSKVYFIPAKSKGLFKHWKETFKVLKAHKEYRTVYFNILDSGAAFTMIIPWLLRRKIVVHSHNGETDKKRLHRLCRRPMTFMADQYLACSKVASEFMFGGNEKLQKKVVVIPNAIDSDKHVYNESMRREKRKELGFGEAQKVICHVGRLSMQKNPFGMLDIFKEVLKLDKKAIFMSVGTGELEAEVKAYASKIGILDSVRFLGRRSDVSELLQAADVFFLPSFYEGLPIVALEAQAAGMHCILSDQITREADITGNVHYLSLKKSNKAWAKALLKAASMPRCDVQKIFSESEFNINNFGKSVEKLKKCL